jgi:mono/diheme cytochrome c family protein
MNDVRKYIYSTLIVFVFGVLAWVGFIFASACGFSASCLSAVPKVERTSIPTLIPATLPAADRFIKAPATLEVTPVAAEDSGIMRPSNPGGPGPAVDLTGDKDTGKLIFETNCSVCHMPQGVGGYVNPGSTNGTVPALNPIDKTLKDPDYKTFVSNIDLFIEHGSKPAGANPVFQMPAWGDLKLLTPQQIADVIAYVISLNPSTLPAMNMDNGEIIISDRGACRVAAVDFVGAWVSAKSPETDAFQFVGADGKECEATFAEIQPLFNGPNLWYSGSLSCISCHSVDVTISPAQLDLSSYAGIMAGSRRENAKSKGMDILGNGNWKTSLLYEFLSVSKADVPGHEQAHNANFYLSVGKSFVSLLPTSAPTVTLTP